MSRRRVLVAGAVVLVLGVTWLLAPSGTGWGRRSPGILQIDLRSSAGTVAQIFWDNGHGFAEERSTRVPLSPGGPEFQRLRFPLADLAGDLRLDPTNAPANVFVRNLRVVDANERTMVDLSPACLSPMNQVASVTREGDTIHIVAAGDDASFLVPVACLQNRAVWYSLDRVSPLSVALACVVVALLLGACLVPLVVDVLRGPSGTDEHTAPIAARLRPAAWLAVLLVVTVAAKLLLMRQFPAPVPIWDQWDAEARALYIPFQEGWLSWRAMFALHNEHRIFFTRLLALLLLLINGQWDPLLQQVVNAFLHAGAAVVLAAVLWLTAGRRQIDLIVLACALVFAPPFAWENTLSGFQSQFYFLLLFSTLTFWLMGAHRVGTWQWFLGWACAFSSLFTVAGGVATPLALLAAMTFRFVSDRRAWFELLENAVASGLVVAVGLAIASPPLSHHAELKARTVAELMTAFGRNLAWPWMGFPWLGLAVWAPLVGLAVAIAMRRRRVGSFDLMLLALGAWVGLQAAAIAYGRGVNGLAPASRYMDTLSLGFIANTMVFLTALDGEQIDRLRRVAVPAVLASWLAFQAVGIYRLSLAQLPAAAVRRDWMQTYVDNVGRFVVDDDLSKFAALRFPFEVPHYDPPVLANASLRDPYIRRILPAAIRQPIRVEAGYVSDGAFIRDGFYPTTPASALKPSWGSYSSRGDAATGRYESQAIGPCSLAGRIRFHLAGYLGWPGLRFAIKDLASGRESEVRTSELAREGWLSTSVRCPTGKFAVVAEDTTSRSWFAFREPVETGTASIAAEWMIARSRAFFFVSLALGLAMARLDARRSP